MKQAARIALVAVILYASYAGAAWSLQEEMLFPGTQRSAPTWVDIEGVEVWRLPAGAGHVEAIYAPHPSASADHPVPLLVFFHGNGGLIDDSIGAISAYHELGVSLLLPEYRGFGRSAGSPSEHAIVEDAVQFIERAVARPEVDATRVVYQGQSLGGGAAAAVANRRPPRALILESTFTSIRDFAAELAVPSFLVRHPFSTIDVLPNLDVPVLLMHATRDPVVPYAMGQQLAALGSNIQFEAFDSGAHILPPVNESERYWSLIRAFLHELTP